MFVPPFTAVCLSTMVMSDPSIVPLVALPKALSKETSQMVPLEMLDLGNWSTVHPRRNISRNTLVLYNRSK